MVFDLIQQKTMGPDKHKRKRQSQFNDPALLIYFVLLFSPAVLFLQSHGILELSLRDLMDLFLPPASSVFINEDDFWRSIPILKQPQFGPYLYDSALLSLTEAELGKAFRSEWMLRIYSLKLHELRHRPANERLYQAAR